MTAAAGVLMEKETFMFVLHSKYSTGGRCHNLKNDKEASEVTEESPAGCTGEGKQSKGN